MSNHTTIVEEQAADAMVRRHGIYQIGFLGVPEHTSESQRIFDEDITEVGYVMNASRLLAYQPATMTGLFTLLRQANAADSLSLRQRSILVAACASTFGDSYCSLVWASRLATASDAQTAAGVLHGSDEGLTVSERVMAVWARTVARDPNATSSTDVQALRHAGFSDAQIFTITVFVALRLAFSTVNAALGLLPDAALRSTSPGAVLDAVTYGRPIETEIETTERQRDAAGAVAGP
jgi:alkylhydroperoxidase family enzyme